jgi:hypothetical protein
MFRVTSGSGLFDIDVGPQISSAITTILSDQCSLDEAQVELRTFLQRTATVYCSTKSEGVIVVACWDWVTSLIHGLFDTGGLDELLVSKVMDTESKRIELHVGIGSGATRLLQSIVLKEAATVRIVA